MILTLGSTVTSGRQPAPPFQADAASWEGVGRRGCRIRSLSGPGEPRCRRGPHRAEGRNRGRSSGVSEHVLRLVARHGLPEDRMKAVRVPSRRRACASSESGRLMVVRMHQRIWSAHLDVKAAAGPSPVDSALSEAGVHEPCAERREAAESDRALRGGESTRARVRPGLARLRIRGFGRPSRALAELEDLKKTSLRVLSRRSTWPSFTSD